MKTISFVIPQTPEEKAAAFERVAHIRETWKKHVQDLLDKSNAYA